MLFLELTKKYEVCLAMLEGNELVPARNCFLFCNALGITVEVPSRSVSLERKLISQTHTKTIDPYN